MNQGPRALQTAEQMKRVLHNERTVRAVLSFLISLARVGVEVLRRSLIGSANQVLVGVHQNVNRMFSSC